MSAPQHQQSEQAPPPPQQEQVMQRAEIIVDQLGQRFGHFLSVAGQQLRKATARAREEAEDIWAEAQEIRHRQPTETH